ncbi:hypothetical protein [Nocardia tenerifensis]|uniref:hypothetical protein n=1 Tax=Nocardia tenerifensis TaxID=228006 RepID=UPI0011B7E74F|nr:hypothetical protein [Nocardia tenerifensis]
MGRYFSPYDLSDLHSHANGAGFAKVDAALVAAGLPGLDTITGGGGFEESMSIDSAAFEDLCAETLPSLPVTPMPRPTGGIDSTFACDYADILLPVAFTGLLPVPEVYDNGLLTIASANELRAQCQALATVIGLDMSTIPELQPEGYRFDDWYDTLEYSEDPSAPIAQREPEAAFYVGLFSAIADYSIRYNAAVRL